MDGDAGGSNGRAASTWLEAAADVIGRIAATQGAAIEAASTWCAEAIGCGGLVHVFGTGHSRIPVDELFPRYGSYPGFNPIVELSMTFHAQVVGANGQRQAMFLERTPGLAEAILSNFAFGRHDVLLVFSATGTTTVPIEMARGARARGLRVIAVTSVAQSSSVEVNPVTGTRLLDEADLVVDICTPAADALIRVDGLDVPIGPGSTIGAVAIANAIKVRAAELLVARGEMPPVLTHSSVVGTEPAAERFERAYADHARRLARAIDKDRTQEEPAG